MPKIEFEGKEYQVDEDGFLITSLRMRDNKWTKYIMSLEGIEELTPMHQKVLDEIWTHWVKNSSVFMVKTLLKNTGIPLKRIYELFPSGPRRGVCNMLGLSESDCRTMI